MTAPVQAPPAAAQGGKDSDKRRVIPARPFIVGSRRVDVASYEVTATLTTATQVLRTYEVDPNGFLGGFYILVTATAASNAATVAFNADAPFNVVQSITFNDTNNKPLIGPMDGFQLAMCGKYGGYAFGADPRNNAIYSATTGAGATGGSFQFILHLPVEFVHRDALGALPNKSSSATFDVQITLNASTAVYSTPPTNQPSVRVRIQQYGWMDPNATDMRGNPVAQNPPGVQTTQYWQLQSYVINAGAFNQRLTGIDSLVRNMIFVLVDSNGSRTQGDSDFPSLFTMEYETSRPMSRLKEVWQYMISTMWGYNGTTPNVAGARDYGVYPEAFNTDFGLLPGAETRFSYLPVSASTTIRISGTIGGTGSHTLYVLVNKIVPANGDPLVLTGR